MNYPIQCDVPLELARVADPNGRHWLRCRFSREHLSQINRKLFICGHHWKTIPSAFLWDVGLLQVELWVPVRPTVLLTEFYFTW